MDYTLDMNLESPSGYYMPCDGEKDIEVLLGYGEQKHPRTGVTFLHHGIDVDCRNRELYALASGKVSGIVSTRGGDFQLQISYGDYDVTYRPITQCHVNIGQSVRAHQTVAMSSNYLHIGVEYKGEEINPLDFIQMVYANMVTYSAANGEPEAIGIAQDVKTDYDADQPEIQSLMEKYFLPYFKDIMVGNYKVPKKTTSSIADVFNRARNEGAFFETISSMANPLGLGSRSVGFGGMILNLLIGDFLAYLAQIHRVFLSTWGEEQKKTLFGSMM